MTFRERDGLRYYTFPSFDALGIRHAVFTRWGGASRAPCATLNIGSLVGDDPAAVDENRRRMFAALGREEDSAPGIRQVHSARVTVARRRRAGEPLTETDGLVTDGSDCTLLMRFADCVPVLLYDPVRRAAGIAHAGWKGTVAKVAARAVDSLCAEFGCRPADIRAGIGPSIGPDHYRVGDDVARAVRASFPDDVEQLLTGAEGSLRLDLWAANEAALREAGVREIECAGICTACHTEDWFSHRGENGKTGRFGALIWLESEPDRAA
jgi:polyphenol oxidase